MADQNNFVQVAQYLCRRTPKTEREDIFSVNLVGGAAALRIYCMYILVCVCMCLAYVLTKVKAT